MQLPLIGQVTAEAEVASSVELSGAKPAASHRLPQLRFVLLAGKLRWCGCTISTMPLISTNDTSSHVQDIFDAVERGWQLSFRLTRDQHFAELLRLIEGGTTAR